MYYHSHVVDFVESASDTRRAVMSMPTVIYNSYLKDHGVSRVYLSCIFALSRVGARPRAEPQVRTLLSGDLGVRTAPTWGCSFKSARKHCSHYRLTSFFPEPPSPVVLSPLEP